MNEYPKYINAKKVYELFAIPRSMLGQLVVEGRIEKKTIEDERGVLNIYSVADIERIINGIGGASND